MRAQRTLTTATLLAATAALAGCGESGVAGPGGTGTVMLSMAAAGSGGSGVQASVLGPSLAITQTDAQGNELVLDSVKLVLREIELERANDECPDDSGTDDNDACEKFATDIRLFELPLDGSVEQQLSVDAPADTYDELEFEIHKPDDDDPEGQAFIDDNPAFADVSIRVVGTYNGTSFTFTQDLNEDQEVELSPPLVVEEGSGPVNVTLTLDVRTWFTQDGTAGGALVDPVTAGKGGQNENLVEQNIENSIEAFEDDDRDGQDDS